MFWCFSKFHLLQRYTADAFSFTLNRFHVTLRCDKSVSSFSITLLFFNLVSAQLKKSLFFTSERGSSMLAEEQAVLVCFERRPCSTGNTCGWASVVCNMKTQADPLSHSERLHSWVSMRYGEQISFFTPNSWANKDKGEFQTLLVQCVKPASCESRGSSPLSLKQWRISCVCQWRRSAESELLATGEHDSAFWLQTSLFYTNTLSVGATQWLSSHCAYIMVWDKLTFIRLSVILQEWSQNNSIIT